jgi:hypothetical protein
MRLTNEFRDELIGRALKHAFGKREKAHAYSAVALADALYDVTHGEAEKIAVKLPQGWVSCTNEIRIEAAGFAHPGHRTNLMSNRLTMSRARPFPRYTADAAYKVGGAHALNDRAQDVAGEFAAIRDEKEALRVKLRAVIYSCTTLAKLREAWPECEKFLPNTAPRQSRALVPVELVPELNKSLGLLTPRK